MHLDELTIPPGPIGQDGAVHVLVIKKKVLSHPVTILMVGNMAHEQVIMKIDSKGRLTIPAYIREELGMKEGSYAAVRINRDERSVVVSLFAGAQARLAELRLIIPDRPGALARAAKALSEFNIDLLSSNSRTLKKGELAEWVVVADISQVKMGMEEVKKRLIIDKTAISVEMKELRV